jgi:hypothetical protein
MKFAADRPFADPEAAARKLLEIANIVEAVQDGRIHIEKLNGPFLFKEGGTPAEYSAGLIGCSAPRRRGLSRLRIGPREFKPVVSEL